jgi:predicted AAA+ superfamily ATPase
MNKSILKTVIREQHKQTRPPEGHIQREKLAVIQQVLHTPEIIVISGIRRCGKSTFLDQIRALYPQSDYYLNFDDDRLIQFSVSDFQLLLEVLIEEFGEQDVFFFDEIQNIPGWERFIRRLHSQGKKSYVTGSNATMLSRELGTHLTGRYYPIELYPFSFYEIVSHQAPMLLNHLDGLTTSEKGLMMSLFNTYLIQGGFPGYLAFKQPDYLKTLFDSILYRDIVSRYHLKDDLAIKETAFFAASNIGKEVSFSKLAHHLGLSNAVTVKQYFHYLESVYLSFLVRKYDPSLKKQIANTKVMYGIDPALSRLIGFRPTEDEGRFLENSVFLELKRRGAELFYHKDKKGCDFLVREGTLITQAIQVSKTIDDLETRSRELAGLADALEHYPHAKGMILTEDHQETLTLNLTDGVKEVQVWPIWKWLLIR